jgi:hypothetical protein
MTSAWITLIIAAPAFFFIGFNTGEWYCQWKMERDRKRVH